jgi:integrase/recombinase XerC
MPDNAPVPLTQETALSPSDLPEAAAVRQLLEGTRSEATRKAYAGDLRYFFAWRGHTDATPEAVRALFAENAGQLALTLNRYKAAMLSAGLSEATLNRRLAAIRSLLRMARRLGVDCPDPAGLVDSEKVEGYRDTRGPMAAEAELLLAAPDRRTLKGQRDFALLMVFCSLALRRGEVLKCNVGDFEPEELRLWIKGKGRGSQRQPITLPEEVAAAISGYLKARGAVMPGSPLFCNVARFTKAETRLSGSGLYHIISTYGQRVLKKPLHPHALRHYSITQALEDGWKMEEVQKLSRHRDIRTLQIYDDRRLDVQGKISAGLVRRLKQGKGTGQ